MLLFVNTDGIIVKRKGGKIMKKIISLIVAAILLTCVFAGCGKEDTGKADTSSIPTSQGENTSSTASEETSSDESVSDKTSSEGSNSDKTSSLVNSMPTTSNKEDAPAACKHTKTKAVSVSTGKHIIDASKLDVLVHNVVCESCNKVLKTENHNVVNGKCTACSQSNFTPLQTGIVDAGPALSGKAQINDDGSVDYDVMLGTAWHQVATLENALDEWNYKIPEAQMLEAIRQKFVITDAQFTALKAQGSYDFFLGDHYYKDGYFYISWPAVGGPGSYTHEILGYKDNKSGSFTVYYDYKNGGPEDDKIEHAFYYAVEYNYTGCSNLTIITGEYDIKQIYGFTPVVQSLRVKSIKKLSTLPSDITKAK